MRSTASKLKALAAALLLPVALVACDSGGSLTGPDAGPMLVRATPGTNGVITARFDRPLNPASVNASAFRVVASLANGRGYNMGAPSSVSYQPGATTVLLQMRDALTGTGTYSVRALNIQSETGGVTAESSATFDFVGS
jgi:hypothetical protein